MCGINYELGVLYKYILLQCLTLIDDDGNVVSYKTVTYGQFRDDAQKIALFFQSQGLVPGEDIIGIFSINNYAYDCRLDLNC